MNLNLNIYCMIYNNENSIVKFKNIITLKNQTQVVFNDLNTKMINLQGIHIEAVTGDFWPYLNVQKCDFGDFDRRNCTYEGFVVDFMDEAAKILNFTWKADILEDWGMFPKSGPGAVFNGF